MKELKYTFIIIFLCLLFLNLSVLIVLGSNIEYGGRIDTSLAAIYSESTGLTIMPQINLDLELVYYGQMNSEIHCAGSLVANFDNKVSNIYINYKKFYLKKRFDDLHLTMGKQPISWSFGSLLNPVDYTLGSTALKEEYNVKYQNAIEIFHPINWNTNLTLVSSISEYNLNWKTGLRVRTLINNFDVSANYIQENSRETEGDKYRLGITAKGDLEPFGVYGSLGYYSEEKLYSLLVGLDYSHLFSAGNLFYVQVEYLRAPSEILTKVLGNKYFSLDKGSEYEDVLVGNIIYKIDEFSNINLATLYNSDNNSAFLTQTYSNQFSSNSALRIQTGTMLKPISGKGGFNTTSCIKAEYIYFEIGLNHSF